MKIAILVALMLTTATAVAHAKNVDLVTLPQRDAVQLTIYNSEDLTLAKETRLVTLKKGSNRLQFSWAGTLIDPTSVEIRVLAHQAEVDVVHTVFPGQKPQHLIWNIQSEFEGQVPIEVSYFTSGLTWQMDYVAVANPAETALNFRGFVRVFNNSGEEYDDAEIRLIVGKVNLVEKIADLARRAGQPVPVTGTAKYNELRSRVMRRSISRAAREGAPDASASAKTAPKQVVKEGVSEYFMFSVEGTETIRNGWSKRMRAVQAEDVAFDIVYRQRSYQYGARPVRFFIWRNDEKHHLGGSPLPNGMIRVFRENGREGLSYLGQQKLNYVPPAAEIEVNLGTDDLVVFEQRQDGTSRFNFAFHPRTRHVTGWDERQRWLSSIRNYRNKPIRFELRLRIAGDVEMTYEHETSSFDFNTVETKLDVPAGTTKKYPYTLTFHQGSNLKQNRVKLVVPQ